MNSFTKAVKLNDLNLNINLPRVWKDVLIVWQCVKTVISSVYTVKLKDYSQIVMQLKGKQNWKGDKPVGVGWMS